MFLAVDIGNSTTTFGLVDNELNVTDRQTVEHASEPGESGHHAIRGVLSSPSGKEGMRCIVISSVVPDRTEQLVRQYSALDRTRLVSVDQRKVDWFRVHYEPVESLGSDRLTGVIGMRELYGYPSILIDFGTATTLNVLDASGDFAGGYILPGMKTMVRSLHAATARLPEISIRSAYDGIPRTTNEAIGAGIESFVRLGIPGMVREIEDFLGLACRVVLTGGMMSRFTVDHPRMVRDKEIILKGIRLYARLAEGI